MRGGGLWQTRYLYQYYHKVLKWCAYKNIGCCKLLYPLSVVSQHIILSVFYVRTILISQEGTYSTKSFCQERNYISWKFPRGLFHLGLIGCYKKGSANSVHLMKYIRLPTRFWGVNWTIKDICTGLINMVVL